MELTARRIFDYAGQRLAVGQRFVATPRDAEILVLIGAAAPAVVPPAGRDLVTQAVEAGGEAPPVHATPKRRRYKRRDLRADE
jgi:hypothetical protein